MEGLSFVSIDIETTGLSPQRDEIIEIGAVRFENGKPVRFFSSLINPGRSLPPFIVSLCGIYDEDLEGAPLLEDVRDDLLSFVGDHVLVGHNLDFDLRFLRAKGIDFRNEFIDTMHLSSFILRGLSGRSLDEVARALNLRIIRRHRALWDALLAGEVLVKLLDNFPSLSPCEREETLRRVPSLKLLVGAER